MVDSWTYSISCMAISYYHPSEKSIHQPLLFIDLKIKEYDWKTIYIFKNLDHVRAKKFTKELIERVKQKW